MTGIPNIQEFLPMVEMTVVYIALGKRKRRGFAAAFFSPLFFPTIVISKEVRDLTSPSNSGGLSSITH